MATTRTTTAGGWVVRVHRARSAIARSVGRVRERARVGAWARSRGRERVEQASRAWALAVDARGGGDGDAIGRYRTGAGWWIGGGSSVGRDS